MNDTKKTQRKGDSELIETLRGAGYRAADFTPNGEAMRISADRQQKLFDAHADPINDLRAELMTRHRNGEVIEIDWLDHQLFKLPFKINERIKRTLGVDDA